jgi:hypothetical protein
MRRLLLSFISMTLLASCAHEQRFTSVSETDIKSCHDVAVAAAGSPETWRRLGGRRLTSEPFNFDLARIQYSIDFDVADRVGVIIPSGGRLGWHPCYVEVTVSRKDYTVIGIQESCWP